MVGSGGLTVRTTSDWPQDPSPCPACSRPGRSMVRSMLVAVVVVDGIPQFCTRWTAIAAPDLGIKIRRSGSVPTMCATTFVP
eukprot:3393896-Lingulodinium_polyedra.AAC.1